MFGGDASQRFINTTNLTMNNCSLNIIEYSQLVSLQKRHTNTYTFLLFNARICHLLTIAQCEVLYAPSLSTNKTLSTISPLDSYFRRYIETMNQNECDKYSNEVRRKFILFIIGILLSIFVIILNTIVTLTILNSIKLRSLITNIFLLNLSIADFLSGCSFLYPCVMNILIEYAIINYDSSLLTCLNLIRNNHYICLIAYAFIMSGMLMSVSILLSISIDKYIYIFKPYSYQKIITKRRCLLWISSLWLISIFIGLLPLLGWNKMKRCSSLKQGLCSSNTCLIDRVFTTGYCSLFATISLLAAIVILYVYVRIFFLARDHLIKIERLRSQYSTSSEHPPTPGTATTLITTPIKINDEKDLQRYFPFSFSTIQRSDDRRERTGFSRVNIRRSLRALRTLLVLLVGFYLCWLPLLIYLLSHTWMDFKNNLIIHVLILIANVNSLVNPIVYAYRSKQFRIELWNGTFGRCCINYRYRPQPSPAATIAAAIACKRVNLLPPIMKSNI